MEEMTLTKTRILAGVWEGVLMTAANDQPRLEVTHLDQKIDGIALVPVQGEPGMWSLRVPIPSETLSDGVQTFLILDANSGARLGQFTVVTGEPLEDDVRGELDLLRAELDMLKRAFRRHCVETMG